SQDGAARDRRGKLPYGRDPPCRRGLRRGAGARAGGRAGTRRPRRGGRGAWRRAAPRWPACSGPGRGAPLCGRRRRAPAGPATHGAVVAPRGEPGMGEARRGGEVTHAPRVAGWLVLQAGALSYGKTSSYLPVVDLLKGYFAIDERDPPRAVREKVTGKLLTLD